jgi:hypothetical protein
MPIVVIPRMNVYVPQLPQLLLRAGHLVRLSFRLPHSLPCQFDLA